MKCDLKPLSNKTKKDLKEALEDVKAGRVYSLEELKKEFKL